MRRSSRLALVAAALLGAASPLVHSGPATAADTPWIGEPTFLGGTARYDGGEWVYTDFVFDDYGADTGSWGQPNVVSLAGTTGDARYPSGGQFRGNAADVVEVRARVLGDDLQVRVLMSTIVDPGVVALWVKAGATESVVTAANSAIDADANTVTFTVPGIAAAGGEGDTVELNIGAGLHDGNGGLRDGAAGNTWNAPNEVSTGTPHHDALMDMAFNTRELEGRGGPWNEDTQSKTLALGPSARVAFAQHLDLGLLRSSATTPVPSAPGYYVRLFESRQDLGEGMRPSFPQYGGRWQPYALWIPDGYDTSGATATPLVLNMHSLSVHHNQYRGGSSPTYRTMYEQVGDGLDAIVVTPLGRGPDGWYEDEALVDTLEVWADVQNHYPVDRDRTLVTGYSMGGYGTYRLSTMMPDAFASAVSVVGPPGNGIWAYPGSPPGGEGSPDWTYPQLENTRHVPFFITHGMGDELVPWTGVKRQADRFGELGHEYRFALHPAADHFSFSAQDDWSREVAWFKSHMTRTTAPDRVTMKVRPASWATGRNAATTALVQALASEVGSQLDGAYWVSDVVVPGAGDVTGVVDLASNGVSRRYYMSKAFSGPAIDGPSPHLLSGSAQVYLPEQPVDDLLTGRLTGVSALTVDVGRARLSDSPDVQVTADRSVTITFTRDGNVVGSTTIG